MSQVVWKKWNPQAVKDKAKAELAQNMEDACQFVTVKARSTLVAIVEPEWGRKYRINIVGNQLTYVVTVEANEVRGTVGVQKGERGQYYGWYIETGTSKYPAHPYLRPAVFNHGAEIVNLLGGH